VTVRPRVVAFASAAVVLLGITGFLALREPGPASRHDARPHQPVGTAAIRTGPPRALERREMGDSRAASATSSPAPVTTPSPPRATRGEGEPKSAPAVAPRDARAATAAARSFLDGYLRYSYGRAEAGRIRAAARPLLRELKSSPPRVPAKVARGRPQPTSVRAKAATSDVGIDVLAVVDDGQRRYSIPLAVRDLGSRWVVIAVNG
jgi:hypothetical protein